jgi:hypothetical protein
MWASLFGVTLHSLSWYKDRQYAHRYRVKPQLSEPTIAKTLIERFSIPLRALSWFASDPPPTAAKTHFPSDDHDIRRAESDEVPMIPSHPRDASFAEYHWDGTCEFERQSGERDLETNRIWNSFISALLTMDCTSHCVFAGAEVFVY